MCAQGDSVETAFLRLHDRLQFSLTGLSPSGTWLVFAKPRAFSTSTSGPKTIPSTRACSPRLREPGVDEGLRTRLVVQRPQALFYRPSLFLLPKCC